MTNVSTVLRYATKCAIFSSTAPKTNEWATNVRNNAFLFLTFQSRQQIFRKTTNRPYTFQLSFNHTMKFHPEWTFSGHSSWSKQQKILGNSKLDSMLKIWIPKSLIELWASTQPEVKAIFISFFSKCFSKKKEMKIKDVVFFLVENFIDET